MGLDSTKLAELDVSLEKADRAMRKLHGWLCENPVYAFEWVHGERITEHLSCELPRGHKAPKAHHGRDSQGREWVWWTYGNDRSITSLCDHPVLT